MPARLVVISGPEAGREIWIESPVCRIGSDPQCQIRLDGVAAHAATLEYRDGAYALLGRAGPVRIEDRAVDPGRRWPWPVGRVAALDAGVQLMLDAAADPSPGRPLTPLGVDLERSAPAVARLVGPSGTHRRIRLVALGLFPVALLFLPFAAALRAQRPSGTFQALVEAVGLGSPVAHADGRHPILEELRAARLARLRGDHEAAARRLSRARAILLKRRDPAGAFPDPWLGQALAYILSESS